LERDLFSKHWKDFFWEDTNDLTVVGRSEQTLDNGFDDVIKVLFEDVVVAGEEVVRFDRDAAVGNVNMRSQLVNFVIPDLHVEALTDGNVVSVLARRSNAEGFELLSHWE